LPLSRKENRLLAKERSYRHFTVSVAEMKRFHGVKPVIDCPGEPDKNPDEEELEYDYDYDFGNDCQERGLSDQSEISLSSQLSASRRLRIVLDFFAGVVLRSRGHALKTDPHLKKVRRDALLTERQAVPACMCLAPVFTARRAKKAEPRL
jgi:hypothetical protein